MTIDWVTEVEGAKGLSNPFEHLSADLLDVLVGDHGRLLARQFLQRQGADLDDWSVGLRSILERFITGDGSFRVAWDLSFGQLVSSLRFPLGLVQRAAASEFALQLQVCGVEGSWEAKLGSPARLRYENVVLPFADRIFAENRGGELKTHSSVKGFVGHDSSTSLLQYLSHRGSKLVFLPAFAAQGPAFTVASTDELPTPLTTVTDSLLVDVMSALDLLKSFAPIYLDWVTKVVKYAVPLTPVSGRDVSHSSNMQPATIAFSANRNPAALAETLVHEASHQYCNILRRLGKLDDGTDSTLYHSPLRGTGRPIGKILVAYHAVANIFLWNRISMNAGAADIDHFRQNAVTLPRQLQVLDEALAATRSLTSLGKLLWEPLRARVLQAMS